MVIFERRHILSRSLKAALYGFSMALLLFQQSVRAQNLSVDVQLIVAADASDSMDGNIAQLQRQGYAEALRSKFLHEIIHNGLNGRIAFSYIEWGDVGQLKVVIPWTVISSPEEAIEVADRLEKTPINHFGKTSISHMLAFSHRYFDQNSYWGAPIIDVSGNGPNNQGELISAVRDRLVADGITINGLPISTNDQTPRNPFNQGFDPRHLERYYLDCVIGGLGSFIVPVRSKDDFSRAIKMKFATEIAQAIKLVPAQFQKPIQEKMPC